MTAIIIGDHPIAANLRQQYEAGKCDVVHLKATDATLPELDADTELFILSPSEGYASDEADNRALACLERLATKYDAAQNGGKKLICHLLLQSETTLHFLQTTDFREDIRSNFNVYPFTMNEVWSRQIRLDHQPITLQSERHAHLVIFGNSEIVESVAINAAHTAHFPNYTRDHSLRTRVTVIAEDIEQTSAYFVSKYEHLFANSYYRIVTPHAPRMVKTFHHPEHESRREDFVDVEWEFVASDETEETVRQKLAYWASDESQVLTVVFAHSDSGRNLNGSMHLPETVYNSGTPIYIYTREASLFSVTGFTQARRNIHPFGMLGCGYDIHLPHIRMAKVINHIYDQFYNDNHRHISDANWRAHYAVEVDDEAMETAWDRLSNLKRQSCVCNALTVPVKMRSVGLAEDEWECFYSLSLQDLDLLAEVEHNRWSVEELILGWRPCTDEEQYEVEADINRKEELKKRKIHYDLRAYNDLRPDGTGRSAKIYDLCLCASLPLITKHYTQNSDQV